MVDPFEEWSIRWKAGLYLLVIVLLIGTNLGGAWLFLQEQKHDGTAIDHAGRQRMLVQKMRIEAHLIGMDDHLLGNVNRAEVRSDLAADVATYNRTLTALLRGNQSMGIPPSPPPVRDHLLAVRAEWRPFHDHLRTILEAPPSSQRFTESIRYVEDHDDLLLIRSDRVVQEYERRFQAKVARFQWFLLGMVGVDLLAIPLLFVLIDQRIIRPIKNLTADARLVATGNLDVEITEIDSGGEVGELANGFREMKGQLVSAIEDVRRFEQAVEHAGHAIYITDTDGTIEFVNPAFEEITGYSWEQAIGANPRILQSGQQSAAYYDELWSTILDGGVWEEEFIDQRASGELFIAYQTIAPITNEDDDPIGFVAILSDHTEEVVSMQQHQVMNRVLRHNLRTELNLIQGYTEAIIPDDAPGDRREFRRRIEERIDNLVTLSSRVGRFTDLLHEEPTEWSQRVCATVDRMRQRYDDVSIDVDIPAFEIEVLANIEVVLEEVVENAIAHNDRSDPEVTITVSLQEEQSPPTVLIAVADDGPGIPAAEKKVIESGEETPLFHGSGLGLWIVYWSVTLAGGKVNIDDREPRGTCVEITLPRVSVSPFPRSQLDSSNRRSTPNDETDPGSVGSGTDN